MPDDGTLDHERRLGSARASIGYLTSRTADEQRRPVPNCPGWTVYHAASHVGRVAIAWEEMIGSTPDDPESRERGYARADRRPPGAPMADLAAWANAAIDRLEGDIDRRCYFSMTGGEGTVALWGWHAASELAVHRLDVEDALEHPTSLADDEALDAVAYAARFFLPAMRRVTGTDPGQVRLELGGGTEDDHTITLDSDALGSVTVAGPPHQVLLAIWGRPHTGVEVRDGDPSIWDGWRALPGQAFQFGAWD